MSAGLVLKSEKGWFAAGVEVEKALGILSDGAFKLFIHLCLLACRDQGLLQISQLELAQSLKKGTQTIRHYLREMETVGICRLSGFEPKPFCRGSIEITDEYWPYERRQSAAENDAGDEFVAAIRRLLDERACVRQGSFSTADAILARQWLARGATLEQVEHAILLGCSRKYVAWRNHQGQAVPIASLRYFEPVLEELEKTSVSPLYWEYTRSRMERMEKLWIQSRRRKKPPDNGNAIA
jgi:hypothetical protein